MRVLMLLWDYYPGPVGGAERQCRKLVFAMRSTGHACTVICRRHNFRSPTVDQDRGVAVFRLGALCPLNSFLTGLIDRIAEDLFGRNDRFCGQLQFWLSLPFLWMSRLSFLLAIRRTSSKLAGTVDAIHVHETGWLAGLGIWLGRKLRVPVVCKARNTPALDVIGYDVPFRGRWHRLRLSAHYIALHETLKDELVHAGIAPQMISVVPNGVDLPLAQDMRRIPGEVLYVGNFSQGALHKGFDILIRAWGIVHKTNAAAQLVMVGGGDYAKWRIMASECGCVDAVSFEGSVADPGIYYRRASLFVLPSRHEGMSNALLEAQSYGLPAVVSDIPANLAVIEDGSTGVSYHTEDASALAKCILDLLANQDRMRELGNAARRRVQGNFEIGIVCAKLLRLYAALT